MHRPRITGTSRTAFTLAELVIVVMILGILAAVGAPRFAASLSRHRAEAAARRVAADLKLAQHRARSDSADKTVSFDAAGNTYSIFPGVDDFDHPGRAYAVDLAAAPYNALLVSADFGGDTAVTFNGFGAPDSDGQVIVRAGAAQRTILVDQASQEISIQ